LRHFKSLFDLIAKVFHYSVNKRVVTLGERAVHAGNDEAVFCQFSQADRCWIFWLGVGRYR
jgi:hypothetical protein